MSFNIGKFENSAKGDLIHQLLTKQMSKLLLKKNEKRPRQVFPL